MTALDSRSVFSCLVVAAATILMAGCEREPLDLDCTALQPGDLAVSELSRKQGVPKAWWIELYNPTDGEKDLLGVIINIKTLSGSSDYDLVVRDRSLTVGAGDYIVLGRIYENDDNGERPEHVDYFFEDDFVADLFSDGIVQVLACGEATDDIEVDWVEFRGVPNQGSLAFDGGLELTAEANDEMEDWCVDDTEADVSGTPGEMNLPCE